jgi:hypothetical protein
MSKGLVFGVGIYEKGKYSSRKNGRQSGAYRAWNSMLRRCYSSIFQERNRTYIGCSVCDEWLEFQIFAEWYEENYPDDDSNYQLDKDLKVIGNKIYSPDACLFVSRAVNSFTIDRCADRGEHLIGVCWNKQREKLQSNCNNPFTKKMEFLGYFSDELSAHLAWRKRKSELAYELAMIQDNAEIRDTLLRWKDALDSNKIHTV